MSSIDDRQRVLDAREQAAEACGFSASKTVYTPDGKEWEVPFFHLFDDDQQIRWDALQFELETWDHEDSIEIPEQMVDGTKIAARTIKGDLKQPYRKGNVLVSPPYNVQLAVVVFGEEGYQRFKAAGGRSSDVALAFLQMKTEWEKRQKSDPKSLAGVRPLEAVRETD